MPFRSSDVVRRVDVRRVADERDRPLRRVERRFDAVRGEPRVGRLLDGGDLEAVLAGELEVALVAARHGHDRPGAVAHQHVVGDPDRDVLAGDRVDGRTMPVGTPVFSRPSSWRSMSFLMIAARRYAATDSDWSEVVSASTSGCSGASTMNVAPNNVSGRVVNTDDRTGGGVEVHRRAVAATDPVALHRLDRVGPVEQCRGRRSAGRRTP